MAKNYTIGVDIKNNADETEKDFKNLNETLDDTAKANDEVNKSFDKGATFAERYGKEIEPLTTKMGEAEDRLYELSLAGDTASKEYQELLASVGNYRKVQIQTDLEVDQAAQTMSQKLGGALNGAASGFAAVQGVMALTGSESEALEESLLKVQGAMAFQQGVQGVLDYSKSVGLASKATALWNAILNLNPLALIATAIIGIVAYLVTFTDALDVAIQMFKDFSDAVFNTGFAEEKLAEERKKRNTEEIARLNELKRVRDIAFKERQKQFDREIALLEAEGKSSFKLRQQKLKDLLAIQKQKASDLKSDVSNANAKLFMATSELERQLAETQLKKYKEFLTEINSEIAESENQLKINVLNNNEEKIESYNSYADSRLAIARRIEDLELEILEDGVEKEIVENKLKFDRLREDTLKATNITRKEKQKLIDLYDKQEIAAAKKITDSFIAELERKQTETQNRIDAFNNAFQDEIEALAEENYQNTLTEQERELLAVQDKYFRLETLAEGNAEALLEIEIAKANEENDIKLKYDQAAYDAKKALDDKAAEDEKKRIEQNFEFAKQGADALQQLSDLVFSNKMSKLEKGSKAEEKLARKQFKFNKALQLSGAVIDAAKAINS
jgi:hypothetical protein